MNVAFLCSGSGDSWAILNGISRYCEKVYVVVESPPSKMQLFRRRLQKLGVVTAVGQLLFVVFNRVMLLLLRSRLRRVSRRLGLNTEKPTDSNVLQVDSINSPTVAAFLEKSKFDLIVVYGTRIIGKRVLSSTESPIVNVHVGITPMYRGVHGGYWALATGDLENFGVTVHLVDAGIDTGKVLMQSRFRPQTSNINEYVLEQVAASIPLLVNVIGLFQSGKALPELPTNGPSRLWYHPTIWRYFWNLVMCRVG